MNERTKELPKDNELEKSVPWPNHQNDILITHTPTVTQGDPNLDVLHTEADKYCTSIPEGKIGNSEKSKTETEVKLETVDWETPVGDIFCHSSHTDKLDHTEHPVPMGTPETVCHLRETNPDVKLNRLVREKGYPNRWGAKIPIQPNWNLQLFQPTTRLS